jgi:hypothetical protein
MTVRHWPAGYDHPSEYEPREVLRFVRARDFDDESLYAALRDYEDERGTFEIDQDPAGHGVCDPPPPRVFSAEQHEKVRKAETAAGQALIALALEQGSLIEAITKIRKATKTIQRCLYGK